MEKKATGRKNPKLRLNKDSLRAVSIAALRNVVGATGGTPCPTPSSDEPQASCVRLKTCSPSCSCY